MRCAGQVMNQTSLHQPLCRSGLPWCWTI